MDLARLVQVQAQERMGTVAEVQAPGAAKAPGSAPAPGSLYDDGAGGWLPKASADTADTECPWREKASGRCAAPQMPMCTELTVTLSQSLRLTLTLSLTLSLSLRLSLTLTPTPTPNQVHQG